MELHKINARVLAYNLADIMYDAFYASARDMYQNGKTKDFRNKQWEYLFELAEYATMNFINDFEKEMSNNG